MSYYGLVHVTGQPRRSACPEACIEDFSCTCRVWLAFLANTALVTGPLVLAQNPVSTLKETVSEARDVRTGRGKLFLILSAFFFVEGLGILAHPTLAQRVSHLPVRLALGVSFHRTGLPHSYSKTHCSMWIARCASCHQPDVEEMVSWQTLDDILAQAAPVDGHMRSCSISLGCRG